ncbi:MAG TPA: hypothetical protein VL137_03540 [Polyangiaceae bacterium]|nr:hypothetical protein [Polyangiaceae bacterium]
MTSPLIAVPAAARSICDALTAQGHGAWVVGGCVRDSLRAQLSPSGSHYAADWDIATSARPEQVQQLFRRVIPTGIEHGTVTVILGKEHYEVTTLRADVGYSDGRRPDQVQFVDDIVADLARRDFTVNAIAYDVKQNTLLDPFGGLDDLRAGRLRAVGDPAQRFAEDGLRVLRAARFVATLEFSLDPATEQAILPSLESYRKVSSERIRDEWLKALKAPSPSRAFAVMRDHGLLEISAPALSALREQTTPDRAFSLLDRALIHLDRAPKIPTLQLASLLHRLAEVPGTAANKAGDLLHALRFSNQEIARVKALITEHRIDYASTWSDASVRRWLQRVSTALYSDLITLAEITSDDPSDASLLSELHKRAAQQIQSGAPLSLK